MLQTICLHHYDTMADCVCQQQNKKKTEEINLPPYDNAITHNRLFHKPALPQVYRNNTLYISCGLLRAVSLVLMVCVSFYLFSLACSTAFRKCSNSRTRSMWSCTRICFLLRSPDNSTMDVPQSFGR